jgi:hypothetical protein
MCEKGTFINIPTRSLDCSKMRHLEISLLTTRTIYTREPAPNHTNTHKSCLPFGFQCILDSILNPKIRMLKP